ncbi:MAG: cytidine deaminase [Clostridia bacterium]|nr:cytidine deaminase [Clostridia bacterium]
MNDIFKQLDFVYRQLIDKAHEARAASYSPYSGIAVGAALLCSSGRIYLGANIENASYSPTVCAERVAFFKAVNAGEREFVAIAVVGAKADEEPSREFPPCGVCRQVMSEFCGPDFVILLGTKEKYEIIPLADLMPHSFTKDDLAGEPEEAVEDALEEVLEDEYDDDEELDAILDDEDYYEDDFDDEDLDDEDLDDEDLDDEDLDDEDFDDEDFDDEDFDEDDINDEDDLDEDDGEDFEEYEEEFDFSSSPSGSEFNFSDEGLTEAERQILGELMAKLSRGKNWEEDEEDLADLAALDDLR